MNKIRSNEEKEKKAKPERARELERLCSDAGNPIKFAEGEYGAELGQLDFKETDICFLNPKATEGLDKEDTKMIATGLSCFKLYLSGCIFTDEKKIHKNYDNLQDPDSRHGWEQVNIYKFDSNFLEYYKSNRINMGSKIFSSLGYLGLIADTVKNSEIKTKIKTLIEKIPKEISEDKGFAYNNASNGDKIKMVKEFSELIKNAIYILENKYNISEN